MTTALDLTVFDPADYLSDAESFAAYLEDAVDDADPGEILEALEVVARAKNSLRMRKAIPILRPPP